LYPWRDCRPATEELAAAACIENAKIEEGGTAKMAERLNYAKAFPEGVHALLALGKVINESGLEPSLQELVKTRASQLNGCAYCIDMHTKDARAAGETEHRLYGLSAWRETPFYTPRERAALAWTEAITNIQQGHAPDEAYEEVRKEFNEADLVRLTLAITQINAWNRIAIGFKAEPGSYQPRKPGKS
jgi:AhpD family alkylhydroperoxidase